MRTDKKKPICAFCDSQTMKPIMDFGKMALAGGFLSSDQFADEKYYPMRLYFCDDCFGVQIIDKIEAETLFKNYFYFSSSIKTLCDHFVEYAEEVTSRFIKKPEDSSVIEFGCNDGVLLRPLADLNYKNVIGIDPASNVVNTINDKRITVINDFFNEPIAQKVIEKYGKIDLIVANNVYAHIPDIQGITRAIKNVLDDEGVFIFEVHYLGKIIEEFQYDMIYHEHIYYHSLLSLQNHFDRYGMVIFDIKPIPIHAGSIRFYVGHKKSAHSNYKSSALNTMKKQEQVLGYNRFETFHKFASDIALRKNQLIQLLKDIRKNGQTVAGYGASGRANTIIQYCDLDHNLIDYIIDDAPAKIGYYTPGSHFEIKPNSMLKSKDRPDYILLFAWSFFKEIAKKNSEFLKQGGKIIVPLPELKVIDSL